MRASYKRAVEALCGAQRIVTASHVNPDGDALGSILALTHALKALGKEVVPISTDGVPDIYAWMPGADWVQTSTERRDFDVAVVCDAGTLERAGNSQTVALESATIMIDIDHHVADGPFGDIQIVDDKAAATAELVYSLIRALGTAAGRDLVSREIAECLMTGLITDTGSFRFMNVTPRTFYLAARLQKHGADPAPIAERVFENRSLAGLKLLGRALDSLLVSADGRVAWAAVTANDFLELHAADDETEGIVNQIRAIRGADVGVLFREIPGRKIRVSLRAREGSDVNAIAAVFGGGGHKLASGCSLDPPLVDAVRLVVAECVRQVGIDAVPTR